MVIVIAILTCISLITAVLIKPTIKIKNHIYETFWIVGLIGALLMVLFKLIPLDFLYKSITAHNSINPLKIVLLLMSISLLSISLDELGFFHYIAIKSIKLVKNSQKRLFFILYLLIAILTVFTSNDIIILTFTLFICYFAKETKINPIPYLVMEFIVANTYSMIFIIGNPTNIYLATINNISFIEYFQVMALPTLFTGLVSAIILYLLFRKQLSCRLEDINLTNKKLLSKTLTIIGIIDLLSSTILLAISSYIHLEMWIISVVSALSLLVILIVYGLKKHDESFVIKVLKRIPISLAFFVISMYTIVSALQYNGIIDSIVSVFNNISKESKLNTILLYGTSSTLVDNLINNIPMSLAYSSIIQGININMTEYAIYSTIIGSNIGAFLTPIGALAGIMWMGILKGQGVRFSFKDFTKYGLILTPILLIVALATLYIFI